MARSRSVWQKDINLPAGFHKAFVFALVATTLLGIVALMLHGDWWYVATPGFFVALFGIPYLSRHLGRSMTTLYMGLLLVCWAALGVWWVVRGEWALGVGLLVYEAPMLVFARRALRIRQIRDSHLG